MQAYEILNTKVEERGIPIAELARRIGISPELLRRSLKGDRKIVVDEFIPLCDELDLNLDDFAAVA